MYLLQNRTRLLLSAFIIYGGLFADDAPVLSEVNQPANEAAHRASQTLYNLVVTSKLQAEDLVVSGNTTLQDVFIEGNETLNGNLNITGSLTTSLMSYGYFATPNTGSAAADNTAVKFGETPGNISNYSTNAYSIGGTLGDTITIANPGTYLINCVLVGSDATTSTLFKFVLLDDGSTTNSFFSSGTQTADEITQFTGTVILATTAANATLKVVNASGGTFTYNGSGSASAITRAITLLRVK